MLGCGIDGASGPHQMAGDRRHVYHVPAFLRLHVWQHSGDAIEHTLDVHIDHALPILHLAALKRRVRHKTGVVEDHVDASVGLYRAVYETLNLFALRHIRLHGSVNAQGKLFRERLKSVEASRAKHQLSSALRKTTRGGFSKSAACARDDD